MKRHGLALILVVGVLAVLAVLGSAFAVLSRLERKAASQRVWGTKAWLLARSGIEDAQARLDAGQDGSYAGEDWSNDRILNAGPETDGQVYQASTLNRDDCPASQALRPSFFRSVGGNPRLYTVQGRPRGYSGWLSGEGSTWSLKVTPPGGFCVNVGDPVVLRRMLGNLAEAIDREDGTDDALPVDQADGFNLVDLRPSSGWVSFMQLRDIALGGSQTKLDALQLYLCLNAWVDQKVIRPSGDAARAGNMYSLWADRTVARDDPFSPGTRTSPSFEARAPVSLPWARTRKPALITLLGGLSGLFGDERVATSYGQWDIGVSGRLTQATLALNWASATDEARGTADRFLTTTSGLETWDQFNAFCDGLPMTGTTNLRQAKRDLLKAMFNPNSDLNKFCPDASLDRLIDKCDLIAPLYSTELDLAPPSGGSLVSVGRILDLQGRLLASRTLSTTLSDARKVRLTTQGELVAEDLGALDRAGDEGAFRPYGASPYIVRSGGTGKTFGHRSFGDPGMSLQSYPEPHTVSAPASWDGQLKLATVETEIPSTATSMLFLASWTTDLDADFALGSPVHAGTVPVPATHSLWSSLEPGMLHPDGIYEEGIYLTFGGAPFDHVLGYEALGNLAPTRGTISVWVKPGVKTNDNKAHVYLNNTLLGTEPGIAWDIGGGLATALFFVQNASNGLIPGRNFPTFYMEDHFRDDRSEEVGCGMLGGRGMKNRRWQLMSLVWDMFQTSDSIQAHRLYFDRAQDPSDRSVRRYGNPTVAAPGVDFQYANGQSGAPAILHLSGEGNFPEELPWGPIGQTSWGPPDAALDELAMYDFGPAAEAIPATEALAAERFTEGRYYKESAYPDSNGLKTPLGALSGRTAGEWFSAPIDLGECRIRSLSWTQVVPRDLRSPAGALKEDGDPGPDAGVLFELAHRDVQVPYAGGAAYALDDAGWEVSSLLRDCRGEKVCRRLKSPFRLHAVFQPNLEDPLLTAILDPLTLDDVTVSYRPVDQSALSDWREGE